MCPGLPGFACFLSIFPQLSVNEMESYSALSMKHISAEFQGRVYHKIFLYSETCWIAVRAVSLPKVMNEAPFFFSLPLPLCFLPSPCRNHLLVTVCSFLVVWCNLINIYATISDVLAPDSDKAKTHKRVHMPFFSTPTSGYIFPQHQDSRRFLETLVFFETGLILSYK